jgi:hypothetical protein
MIASASSGSMGNEDASEAAGIEPAASARGSGAASLPPASPEDDDEGSRMGANPSGPM